MATSFYTVVQNGKHIEKDWVVLYANGGSYVVLSFEDVSENKLLGKEQKTWILEEQIVRVKVIKCVIFIFVNKFKDADCRLINKGYI
ncbi:hypothetical protein CHUAL_005373 [Chamberlinius hualienensis]